jgi:hypothetical protein
MNELRLFQIFCAPTYQLSIVEFIQMNYLYQRVFNLLYSIRLLPLLLPLLSLVSSEVVSHSQSFSVSPVRLLTEGRGGLAGRGEGNSQIIRR